MSRAIDAVELRRKGYEVYEKYHKNPIAKEALLEIEKLIVLAPTIEQSKWISCSKQMPDFFKNEDGCLCSHGKLLFRCEWDKTVHLGYCIKLIYIINTDTLETIETIEWYDDHGNKWENVSHWAPLPKEEHIEDKA